MNRVYFIDSENVGDVWTMLLDNVDQKDELLVFFTAKSPHMSYKNLIRLKESPKDVTFIECFEGNNALDFQLVSELGYRIAADPEGKFYIISNDNGFESAVKYWKKKNVQVKRLPAKAILNLQRSVSEQTPEEEPFTDAEDIKTSVDNPPAIRDTQTQLAVQAGSLNLTDGATAGSEPSESKDNAAPAKNSSQSGKRRRNSKTSNKVKNNPEPAEVKPSSEDIMNEPLQDASAVSEEDPVIQEAAAEAETAPVSESAPESAPAKGEDITEAPSEPEAEVPEEIQGVDSEVLEVLYCVGKENLADLHEALVQLYGDKRCQLLYNSLKSDMASYETFLDEHETMFPDEKQRLYCKIIFQSCGMENDPPFDLAESVVRSWRRKKNLNSLRAALQSKYGKDIGKQYYMLVKAHVKILDNIS